MLKTIIKFVFILIVLVVPFSAMAEVNQAQTSTPSVIIKRANDVFSKIGVEVKSIKPAPVKGLYEILVEKGGRPGIAYMDESAKFIIQGVILDLDNLQPVFSHPKEMVQPKQQTTLDVTKIPSEYAVVIGNPKGTKNLYVFTDPDCPYCHKMHVELKKLEKIAPDVAIHIMLFPLPMHPGAYDKARAIFETKDKDILDKAFEGKDVPKPTKESSKAAIDAIIKFANENGIGGTPTLVLGDGKIVVGMRDAETLNKLLAN